MRNRRVPRRLGEVEPDGLAETLNDPSNDVEPGIASVVFLVRDTPARRNGITRRSIYRRYGPFTFGRTGDRTQARPAWRWAQDERSSWRRIVQVEFQFRGRGLRTRLFHDPRL